MIDANGYQFYFSAEAADRSSSVFQESNRLKGFYSVALGWLEAAGFYDSPDPRGFFLTIEHRGVVIWVQLYESLKTFLAIVPDEASWVCLLRDAYGIEDVQRVPLRCV